MASEGDQDALLAKIEAGAILMLQSDEWEGRMGGLVAAKVCYPGLRELTKAWNFYRGCLRGDVVVLRWLRSCNQYASNRLPWPFGGFQK